MHARCKIPLADKRVYRPRRFHVPLRFARRGGTPLASGLSLRSAVYITGRYVNPPGACGARRARRGRLKACHCACALARACVCGPRRGCGPPPTRAARSCQAGVSARGTLAPRAASGRLRAAPRAVLDHLAGMLPPARRPARRGPCPRAGSRTRRDENRRCRARKRRTERDAPTAPAPKARSKILRGAPRSHRPRRRFGAKPPRAASWCAKGAPQHIALALCEGRDSAPEACGVPPRSEAQRDKKAPGTVIGHYRPAATRERVDAARVTGRGTWGPARRARCRAPGTNAPHAGARRARGRMVRRVRREESRSGRRSREPVARRAACARARRPSTCTRARRWSRASQSKRRDVAGRQRGRCDPSRGITIRRLGSSVVKTKTVWIGDQNGPVLAALFPLDSLRGNRDPPHLPRVH